ncbi:MAG: hypothetical protein C5S46_06840 [Candidatus Methanomarinus sp.]|uniref:Uncharacterized protein n=1 Tax=Candidatus Methanomarinus sp. TaxID=3386244 RepID=A0AC61S9Q7_9EURY|nr:MAG: hypothetical protein C5S41_07050 [ANME-2 cluster archaeon]KAF5427805.1 hypothetical protein C5S42_04300 [ANME-2 cluster archaeon]TKY91250.1 MAG: hypothetical protein C5S46_06840 [ANME-2 cluster archaeon]
MKKKKIIVHFSVLLLMLIVILMQLPGSVADTDVTIRPSIMVECSVDPEYLMPGDEGTVAVTLKNAAKTYSYSVFVDENEEEVFELSAQVLDASLLSTDNIQVTSDSYHDVGLLGPGDTIDFTYSINIDQDAKDGIHFLNFVFVGGGDMYDVRWKVPVTVDSSQVEIISTESLDGSHYVVLDIANTRPNTINAVTIIPVTENVTFEPAQYFIGTMDSDEMFTIRFDVDTDDDIDRIRIKASFKNGNNWHESAIQTFGMNNSKHETAIESESNPLIIIGIVGGILVVLVVFFVIMRRRRRSNEES